MTAREKIRRAFTPEGTPEIGVVASYDGIFIRDHWFAFTEVPWWYTFSGKINEEVIWVRDFCRRSGLEWLEVRPCPSRAERSHQRYEQRQNGVWRIDEETGDEEHLQEPTPGGINTSSKHFALDLLPTTQSEVDALISQASAFDRASFLAEGRHDTATAIGNALDLILYGAITSPLWSFYSLLGYEGMMVFLAQDGDLASYAAGRILRNVTQRIRMVSALGADAVWIEECLTDQISPELFWQINVPILQKCVQEIRACGLKSIYYYCGNPGDRLEAILEVGADAVHFEESKKGFTVDIEEIIAKVDGRCTVFGNLDSIALLQDGTETELRTEIKRQLEAGKKNGNRFVMSIGSPITPRTPVERIKLYTDVVQELGA